MTLQTKHYRCDDDDDDNNNNNNNVNLEALSHVPSQDKETM